MGGKKPDLTFCLVSELKQDCVGTMSCLTGVDGSTEKKYRGSLLLVNLHDHPFELYTC